MDYHSKIFDVCSDVMKLIQVISCTINTVCFSAKLCSVTNIISLHYVYICASGHLSSVVI